MAKTARKFALLLVLCCGFCVNAPAQQSHSGATTDVFLGKWKLNVAKSSPGPTAETITIEPEKNKYRITLEAAYSDGLRTNVWTVTDMKGWASPLMHADGQQSSTDEEWRVKRVGPDSFTIAALFRGPGGAVVGRIEWRYTSSSDGMTLTRRVIAGGPTGHETQVLVFDRVP